MPSATLHTQDAVCIQEHEPTDMAKVHLNTKAPPIITLALVSPRQDAAGDRALLL